jgi:colicin import membrane protein
MTKAINKHETVRVSFTEHAVIHGIRPFFISVFLMLFASFVSAQQTVPDAKNTGTVTRYSAGSIKSVDEADAALAEMSKERADVEARHILDKQACHPKFFATACIDEAKERRRKEIMQLRSIEIEAHAFMRQARVNAREQALADRQTKGDTDGRERQREQRNENVAPRGQEFDQEKPAPAAENILSTKLTDSGSKGQAKRKTIHANDVSTPEMHAEKVRAYEKKVQAAYKRQQQVLDRKAEKEKRRQKKQPSS